jgi:hypothetical protein
MSRSRYTLPMVIRGAKDRHYYCCIIRARAWADGARSVNTRPLHAKSHAVLHSVTGLYLPPPNTHTQQWRVAARLYSGQYLVTCSPVPRTVEGWTGQEKGREGGKEGREGGNSPSAQVWSQVWSQSWTLFPEANQIQYRPDVLHLPGHAAAGPQVTRSAARPSSQPTNKR